MKHYAVKTFPVLVLQLFVLFSYSGFSQSVKNDRSKYEDIIKVIKNEIEKKYFDPKFRGVNLEEKSALAIDLIKQANSEGEMMRIVANFLLEFDDFHLFYIPPMRVSDTDYGWEVAMVGDKCFVTEVSPGSDAEAQGLKVGDEIYSVEGFIPTSESLWKISYFYRVLIPHPSLNVIVIKPNGKKFQYVLKAKITRGKSVYGTGVDDWKQFEWRVEKLVMQQRNHRIIKAADNIMIWKMPFFNLPATKVDDIFGKMKNDQVLIFDLRGNGGGRVDMLLRVMGNIFSEDITVGKRASRKKSEDLIAKSRGKNSFTGKIAVLIDNDSASASEILAKVIQVEKRGIVLGDVSAGKVMESQIEGHKDSVGYISPYALSMTVADLIMKDGKSLEKNGVTPDEKILPTALDLVGKCDPVLSRAIEILGYKMTSEEAGRILEKDRK